MNDSKFDPPKHSYYITEMATDSIFLNCGSFTDSVGNTVIETHIRLKRNVLFHRTSFYIPSAPHSTSWEQRRKRYWLLKQLLSALSVAG